MNKLRMRYFPILLTFALLSACANIKIQEVDPSLQLSHVCIEKNSKVVVNDFIPVVRSGFTRHGISTEIYTNQLPNHCEHHLTYTALRRWDLKPFLSHAELWLYQGQNEIGYAEYHLTGGGGFDLGKFASVKSKMTPVIDKLLAAFTPESVDVYRKAVSKTNPNDDPAEDSTARLRELKKWRDEDLIDEDEYQVEKQKILSEHK